VVKCSLVENNNGYMCVTSDGDGAREEWENVKDPATENLKI
jgi:hypothetical protein